MRTTVISIMFLLAVSALRAQQFPTNNVSQQTVVQWASSRLRLGMREEDIAGVFDKPTGLQNGGGNVGDNTGWVRFYLLSNGCSLDLEIEPKHVRSDGKWGSGLLKAASIQSNGVKIVSITLTNAP